MNVRPLSASTDQVDTYWNIYYKTNEKNAAPHVPSQFAAFVLSEIRSVDTQIVDFGCGNGRDTSLFACYGIPTIGVDRSEAAIEECIKRKNANSYFICASINDDGLSDRLFERLRANKVSDVTAYARFFVHAIDQETQARFLKLCRAVVGDLGRLALEFRTMRDMDQKKNTSDHYRRFVDPLEFMNAATQEGFRTSYFVEGFGYAKYRDDDAHVARFILEPVT